MTPSELLLARRAANITQGELALRLGYSRQSIVKWERGVHAIPDKVVAAIVDAFAKPSVANGDKASKRAGEILEVYSDMRKIGMSHAAIITFWQKQSFVPTPEACAAIAAAFPDILDDSIGT